MLAHDLYGVVRSHTAGKSKKKEGLGACSHPVWDQPRSVATVVSEKELKQKEDDVPPHVGWRHRKRSCLAAWRCRPLWPGLGLAGSQHTLTKLT